MRVISGTARGSKLLSQPGLNTRPTLDRVKEALFNIIQFNIAGSNVLDLFAGSGALGIEALSRGANKANFCDNNKDSIAIIEKNIEKTKLKEKSKIYKNDYLETLETLYKNKDKFDIIFLDPPYKKDFALIALRKIIECNLLTKEGIVVLETNDANKKKDISNLSGIEIFDERKYGSIILIFIRKE